jgi:hypothetical protein
MVSSESSLLSIGFFLDAMHHRPTARWLWHFLSRLSLCFNAIEQMLLFFPLFFCVQDALCLSALHHFSFQASLGHFPSFSARQDERFCLPLRPSAPLRNFSAS